MTMDYFLIEFILLAVMAITFFILSINEDTFPRNIIWNTVSMILSFTSSLFILTDYDQYSMIISGPFFFFGFLNLALITITSLQVLRAREQEKWKI